MLSNDGQVIFDKMSQESSRYVPYYNRKCQIDTMPRDESEEGRCSSRDTPSIMDEALHKFSQFQHVNPVFIFERF